MYDGYLRIGDVEVINDARVKGYATTAGCPLSWFDDVCEGLDDALGEDGRYQYANITQAPWYDLRNPESERFYGVTGVSFKAISDSTRAAEVTEGITDGGVIGQARSAGVTVRISAWLSANGEDALEYGMSWLRAVARGRVCEQHGTSCGGSSVMFFASCPPARAQVWDEETESTRPQTDEEYLPLVVAQQRYLHGAAIISGPFEVETRRSVDGTHYGRRVEFTIYAEHTGIYSAPRDFGTLVSVGEIVDDVIHNLVPYPSAELSENQLVVAYNHVTNPSLELNDAGWVGGLQSGDDNPTMPAIGVVTKGIVKGARSYAGEASYLARWLGDGKTLGEGSRDLLIEYEQRSMPGITAGDLVTITIWAALVMQAGTPLQAGETLTASYVWVNSSGATVGFGASLGTASGDDRAGSTFSLTGIMVPSGATGIRFAINTNGVAAYSSPDPTVNRDVRLYADAAGVIEEV